MRNLEINFGRFGWI